MSAKSAAHFHENLNNVAETKHFAHEKAKQGSAFIKAHPYETAGVALGIGTLLGFLVARREN